MIATALAMYAGTNDDRENRWFRLYDGLGRLTLGQLLERLKPHEVLSQEVVQMLNDVKDRRNALAHSFFRPRETATSSATTAMIAIEELQKAATLFSHVSIRLESAVHEMLGKLHVSRSEAEIQLVQLRDKNTPDWRVG